MKKLTLTLIALAVSSTTQATTLDIKGEIQISGKTVITSDGKLSSPLVLANQVDLDHYMKNPNSDIYLSADEGKHTFVIKYINGIFSEEIFSTDGEVTWSGKWSDWMYDGDKLLSSNMVSHNNYKYDHIVHIQAGIEQVEATETISTKCVDKNHNSFSSSEPYGIAVMGEEISRIDIFVQNKTRVCTQTYSYSDNYPDVTEEWQPSKKAEGDRVIEDDPIVTNKKEYEFYTLLPLYKTSFDNDGISSSDCLVVKEVANWATRVKTYCSGLGLVTFQSGDILYQQVSQLSDH